MEEPAGLRDVVVTDSAITRIDGARGELEYRGYPVAALAQNATFEEVAYLLWYGELPTLPAIAELRAQIEAARSAITGAHECAAVDAMRALPPTAHPLEAIRVAVTTLAADDPDREKLDRESLTRQSVRITALMPLMVGAWDRIRYGLKPLRPIPGMGVAASLVYALTGTSSAAQAVRDLDRCLVLHADHELNASAFTARVVAATEADIYSAISAALGALKGPKHGGANQDVIELFDEIGLPEDAERVVMEKVERYRRLSRDERRWSAERLSGFGHAVYKVDDPRAVALREIARRLSAGARCEQVMRIAETVRATVQRELGLPVNVDFYSAVVYRALGIAPDLCTSVFAVARTAGWTAHVIEQLTRNRLIRPRAEYVGPPTRMPPAPSDGVAAEARF